MKKTKVVKYQRKSKQKQCSWRGQGRGAQGINIMFQQTVSSTTMKTRCYNNMKDQPWYLRGPKHNAVPMPNKSFASKCALLTNIDKSKVIHASDSSCNRITNLQMNIWKIATT